MKKEKTNKLLRPNTTHGTLPAELLSRRAKTKKGDRTPITVLRKTPPLILSSPTCSSSTWNICFRPASLVLRANDPAPSVFRPLSRPLSQTAALAVGVGDVSIFPGNPPFKTAIRLFHKKIKQKRYRSFSISKDN